MCSTQASPAPDGEVRPAARGGADRGVPGQRRLLLVRRTIALRQRGRTSRPSFSQIQAGQICGEELGHRRLGRSHEPAADRRLARRASRPLDPMPDRFEPDRLAARGQPTQHPRHRHPTGYLGLGEQLVGRHRQLTRPGGRLHPRRLDRHAPTAQSDRPVLGAVAHRRPACVVLVLRSAHRFDPQYTAAKAGLVGLTKTLAVGCGPDGITDKAVSPGVIDTPQANDPVNSLGPRRRARGSPGSAVRPGRAAGVRRLPLSVSRQRAGAVRQRSGRRG